MEIQLLAFGKIAEMIHSDTLTLPDGSCVADFKKILETADSRLQNMSYRIAVNKEIANDEVPLSEGCEVALLPPFSGG
jgi:molybdopterin converting factor small subunit